MTEAGANSEMKTVGERGWVRWVVSSALLFVAAVLGVLFYLLVPSYLEDTPTFADHGIATLMSRNISLAPASNRPYIGITYQELNPQAGDRASMPPSGAAVTSVVPSGPAAMAGLNTGDIILALDGQAIGKESPFLKLLFSRRSGDRVTLSVQRGQEHLTLYVLLGKR
ncbi:MAG: PDZ domain-containing protein [Dehalococcoidia bacterium]|nr:PDZ domain-containing protein [Dehalococcoidia bacterium]